MFMIEFYFTIILITPIVRFASYLNGIMLFIEKQKNLHIKYVNLLSDSDYFQIQTNILILFDDVLRKM